MDIYIGNLPWAMDDAALQALFAGHGAVRSAKVILDRVSGRSRGFGFVAMADPAAAEAAIRALDGATCAGRALRVRASESRQARAVSA